MSKSTDTVCNLHDKKCIPCEGGVPALTKSQVADLLPSLNAWQANTECTSISKKFTFKGFYKTMAFVNAIAWIAQQQQHHPDLQVGYNYCTVVYTTHAIDGLSENDFICAAKIDKL